MNPWYILGLILCATMYGAVGIGLRWYATRHWKDKHGVLYRQAAGLGAIWACTALYELVFQPPFSSVWIIPLLAIETLIIVLLFEREGILEYEEWEGISENGNLRYKAIQSIEDCIAAILTAQDMQRMAEHYLQEEERAKVQVLLQLQDLRHLRDTLSVADWRKRVDDYLERMRQQD